MGAQFKYRIAHKLVFHKLHAGRRGPFALFCFWWRPPGARHCRIFSRCRHAHSEGYGLTETCPALTANRYNHYKFGTVGASPARRRTASLPPMARFWRVDPTLPRAITNGPKRPRKSFWRMAGLLQVILARSMPQGFYALRIVRRTSSSPAGGKNIAPQNIENLLKTDRYISQAMVYGDRRPYLTAVLTLDWRKPTLCTAQGICYASAEAPGGASADPQVTQRVSQGSINTWRL